MRTAVVLAIAAALGGQGARAAEDSKSVLDQAAAALGVANLKSIQVSGRGFDHLFGQAYDGDSPWPRFNVPRYTLTVDYVTPALRDERTRTQAQNPPLGGGNQPIGEQRQVWSVSGSYAWNGAGQAAGAERDQRSAAEGRQTQIWLTPHGFIKAALAATDTNVTRDELRGATKRRVAFTAPNHVKLQGVLNDRHLVERIETWLSSPVLGDTLFEVVFQDYKDFGGVSYPTHVMQREGGYPVLDLTVTDVKANVAETIEVPAAIRQPRAAASSVMPSQKLADGVWSIALGPRDRTVAVEFLDHIVAIEAPESEDISVRAIEAIKRAIPNKPIRYIVNTHIHFDHSGGLRAYAAEGAIVVTDQSNVGYYQQVWANPWTIHPDRLARSGKKPVFEGIVGSRTFADASRRLVVYHYAGNFHHPGMLMVFLPAARILIEADSYNPPNTPGDPPTAIPNLVQFVGAVDRLGLDVEQIAPIHGRLATFDEARKAAETYKSTQLWAE
jgi:glyoxylase-like metal-dependent hydrolase (beta-lactamase superfamily II)